MIMEKEKYIKALERVQDSYDLGDYSREDFLKCKEHWQNKINAIKEELILLNKEYDINRLYRTIFQSILWKRIGEQESELKINFL